MCPCLCHSVFLPLRCLDSVRLMLLMSPFRIIFHVKHDMYVELGSVFHTVKDLASFLIPPPHLEGFFFFFFVQSSGVTFLVTDYGNRMPSEAILPFSQSGSAPASKPYFPSRLRILANTKSKILVLYNKRGNEDGI